MKKHKALKNPYMRALASRSKGKRGERMFVRLIKGLIPDLARNYNGQAYKGGIDLYSVEFPQLEFESKIGSAYKSKMIRDIIKQMVKQGTPSGIKIGVVKPDREDPYAIMPIRSFLLILQHYVERRRDIMLREHKQPTTPKIV